MSFEEDVYDLIDDAYKYVKDSLWEEQTVEKLRKILRQRSDTPVEVLEMIGPHLVGRIGISYESRERRTPSGVGRTANKLAGDCVDQSVYIATMYESLGHKTRLRSIDLPHTNAPHMIVEAQSNWSADSFINHAANFYWNHPSVNAFNLDIKYHDSSRQHSWFPIDPTASRYVGDIKPLVDAGYIRYTSPNFNTGNNWEYTNLLLTEKPDWNTDNI